MLCNSLNFITKQKLTISVKSEALSSGWRTNCKIVRSYSAIATSIHVILSAFPFVCTLEKTRRIRLNSQEQTTSKEINFILSFLSLLSKFSLKVNYSKFFLFETSIKLSLLWEEEELRILSLNPRPGFELGLPHCRPVNFRENNIRFGRAFAKFQIILMFQKKL